MPTRHEYTAAMQNPGQRFLDPELSAGRTVRKGSGQPVVYSGQFASVYRLVGNRRERAVRCFVSEAPDRQQRYRAMSDYLCMLHPPGFVDFEYLDRELLVGGERHPVVKMDWVEGETLDKYVGANRNDAGAMRDLARRWLELMTALQDLSMAHNDLQHGNVIVAPSGEIRLVDYDGVFVDTFQGQPSPELGHRNYQHPARTARDYDRNIDNFPALVIHLSLTAVGSDPTLWDRFHNGDNLLFTRKDLENPGATPLWSALASCPDPTVRKLTTELRRYCRLPVARAPTLGQVLGRRASAGAPRARAGKPPRLTLKTGGRRRQSTPPGGAGSPGQRTGSPGLASHNRSTGSNASASAGVAGPHSSGARANFRAPQLEVLARKSMATAIRIGRVTGKAVNRSANAVCKMFGGISRGEADIVGGLCIFALLALPAFVVVALYHLFGDLTSILITHLVCSAVGAAVWAWLARSS